MSNNAGISSASSSSSALIEITVALALWSFLPISLPSVRKSLTNMPSHSVFGVERDIDIPDKVFPSKEFIDELEKPMEHCQHGWMDSIEGVKLHYRKFVPPKPKAAVVFIHGIATHGGKAFEIGGRKLSVALSSHSLYENDIAMYALDLPGHGYSEGNRFYVKSWENNRLDIIKFIKKVVCVEHSDVPVLLMGESYGSTLTINTARYFQDFPDEKPTNFDSIIVLCPAILVDMPAYPVYLFLRYGLASMAPKWSPFFMPDPVSPERIWRDKTVCELMKSDKMKSTLIDGSVFKLKLGTAVSVVDAISYAKTKAIPGFSTPFCTIHGTEDHGVFVAGSEYMMSKSATTEKVFHPIDGGYHDLLSDPNAEQVAQHIVDWVTQRVEKAIKK